MAFAIHHLESALGVHMSPPSWIPLPPPSISYPSVLSQSTGSRFPASYIKLPLAICFTYGNVYVSVLLKLSQPMAFHSHVWHWPGVVGWAGASGISPSPRSVSTQLTWASSQHGSLQRIGLRWQLDFFRMTIARDGLETETMSLLVLVKTVAECI